MPTDTTDRRAALRAAFEAAEKENEPIEEPAAVEEPVEPAEPEAAAEAEAAPVEGAEPAEEKGDRGRDDKGRFVPQSKAKEAKVEAKPAPKTESVTPQPKPATQTATQAPASPAQTSTALRPPQSWTAGAREVWKDVPPVAQAEIHRLEGETRRVLQDNAGLRRQVTDGQKFREGIDGFVRPFEGIFRARGQEPLQGVANVVQTYAALHYAPPAQKAAILADLIGQFSTVDDVNAVLSGQAPPAPQNFRPPPQQAPVDVDALVEKRLQAWQDQALSHRAENEWTTFEGTNPEFLADVRDDMQSLLDSAAARGRNLTYQEAYDRACKMNESVQTVLAQRKAAESARAAAAQPSATTAQRARTAASTVRSRPATAVQPAVDPNDRRAMLERNWNASE